MFCNNLIINENMGNNRDIKIFHEPTGYDNPYFSERIQRQPSEPLEGDNVVINMITRPFDSSHSVYIDLFVNKRQIPSVKMEMRTSESGENFWEADLGKFKAWDEVEYCFSVINDTTQIISQTYSFFVGKWEQIGKPVHTIQNDRQLEIVFEQVSNCKKSPYIILHKVGMSALKCTFGIKHMKEIRRNDGNGVYEATDLKYFLETSLFEWLRNDGDFEPEAINTARNIFRDFFIEILRISEDKFDKVKYKLPLKANEKIYGMGERYSHLQFRGKEVDNFVYNQYLNQGLKTYLPIPFFISSAGYGLLLDTAMYSVFRFAPDNSNHLEIEADLGDVNVEMSLYFFFGKPKEILNSYTDLTGKPELPPNWVFGPWMSSNNWNSQAEVLKQVQLTKKHAIPATVIVLEQWSDETTFYIFNDARYNVKPGDVYLKYEDFTFPEDGKWPDPKGMVQELHDEGIRILLWQAPVQKYMHGVKHEQRDEDERTMLKNGYCVKYEDGSPYRIPYFEWFDGSLIPDFTNPNAAEWWLNKRLYLIKDIGIDGFKTDGGECVFGKCLRFHNGKTGAEMRNLYPYYYIKAYNEFLKKHGGKDKITFSRSGYTGIQKFPLHWAGDEQSTFEAFRASVRAGLNCGASGIPFWGWDIAGFDGDIPTPELFIRSAGMAAFCPVMQYHTAPGELNKDRTPWNLAKQTGNEKVIETFKKYADLRMNLLPYITAQAKISSRTGIPLMRAMFIEYPDDRNCEDLDQQYFFGDSLLVAPVMEENGIYKDIYLPDGLWIDLFSNKTEEGGRFLKVRTELDEIPVFMKENSIIPLNLSNSLELFSHVGNQTDKYTNLCFMIFITGIAKYVYEDYHGNVINIEAGICESGLSINFSSSGNYPVFLIIRNGYRLIYTGDIVCFTGCSITHSCSLTETESDAYTIRNNDILVKLYPGTRTIHFGRMY
ncbi:MAG TPA: glycoside hydrolase family 31 protein [Clostridiaceae bacterium]|nr:glycoside hydrolase family 31 protein [Clostridiaceae bacterium]